MTGRMIVGYDPATPSSLTVRDKPPHYKLMDAELKIRAGTTAAADVGPAGKLPRPEEVRAAGRDHREHCVGIDVLFAR